jgi:diketogulonate reductase-like aldo/keto reductase
MIYKQIGETKVPAIGQGTMGLDNLSVLKMGCDYGMTLIDTAENYGTEEMVGQAMKDRRNQIFLSTKVSPEHLAYKDVIKSAERSLKHLKTDYIDLYQIHWPNPAIPIADTLVAMERLVKDGKVLYIGVSNFSLRQLKEACGLAKISSIQIEYNLFDRTIEDDILPYCEANNIAVIAYKPLNGGVFGNGILRNLEFEYGKSIATIILCWLINHKLVFAIPKMSKTSHIKENSDVNAGLTERDIKLINDTFQTKVIEIPIDQVETDMKGIDKFCPSPQVLSTQIDDLKPIRVVKYDGMYKLVEGKVRYWAHVFANKKTIKALVK